MILKNNRIIDKFMLETTEDPSDLIDFVTKNMRHELIEAMIDKIEPDKDYLIRLRGADFYEETSIHMCGYKMALEVDGWTPCSERMPATGEFVLLSGEIEGETRILIAGGDHVRYWGNKFSGLAWMPLPEPYRKR